MTIITQFAAVEMHCFVEGANDRDIAEMRNSLHSLKVCDRVELICVSTYDAARGTATFSL
jgi:hypothetical protein